MSILFTNCSAKRIPSDATAGWVLVEADRIAALGPAGDEPDAERVIDLGGAFLYPAFTDAHVHLPATGLYMAGMDLRGERSGARILDGFAERANDPSALLFGGNFEEPLDRTILRGELDAAVGNRPALLMRADMHSCVVSTALLDRLKLDAATEGIDRDADGTPTGYLREQAAAAAWRWYDTNLPAPEARAAIRRAVQHAYSRGVTCVHEMHVVEWRGWETWDLLADAVADLALTVVPYIATDDVDRILDMGFHRIGGDFFLDGSFGSHTAWLSEPYLEPPPGGSPVTGISYRDDDDLHAFFSEAQAKGLQVGVHAIGDAAIEQAIAAWERVAQEAGLDAVRSLGHRIEHFECSSDDHIARAGRLGLRASVQPAFDLFWGGEDGLYAERIGWERASLMNRFATMLEHPILVGAGSDSAVTPLDPFVQMAALRSHHVEDERFGRTLAIRTHTLGSRALAFGHSLDGSLEPGAIADLVCVPGDIARTETEEMKVMEVLGTWAGGKRVWPPEEAESE